jgi:two-component system, chemotaxis family, chemotaxis protein CheY
VRAMVIDDSRAIRLILGKMLKELGFEVVDAENGAVAIERLKESEKVDIALVDWNMPEMNGYEFVCAVRKEEAYKDLPLMMVTTETEMSQVVKALEAGANEYVMKPFTKEMITEKLTLMGMPVG